MDGEKLPPFPYPLHELPRQVLILTPLQPPSYSPPYLSSSYLSSSFLLRAFCSSSLTTFSSSMVVTLNGFLCCSPLPEGPLDGFELRGTSQMLSCMEDTSGHWSCLDTDEGGGGEGGGEEGGHCSELLLCAYTTHYLQLEWRHPWQPWVLLTSHFRQPSWTLEAGEEVGQAGL